MSQTADVPSAQPGTPEPPSPPSAGPLRWIAVVGLAYGLIVAVGLIGAGFRTAVAGRAEALFAVAVNPFLGLIVGIMATALIQSSSTVTSIIVGLVAGGLPVSTAVPMIMGANMGTTVTNTLVSLGHLKDNTEFRLAFAAATVHDFFNLLSIAIFFPLELLFHLLEKTGLVVAKVWVGDGSVSLSRFNAIGAITQPVVHSIQTLAQRCPVPVESLILIGGGIGLIILTITLIGTLLKQLMVGRAKTLLQGAIGRGPLAGLLAGTLMTVLVQSSSTTTSLMVPLAGAGVLELAQIYPFVLGANVGTCITALLAATAISGANAVPALDIAMVHLLYNSAGVALIYGVPVLRHLPLRGANALATVASDRKLLAIAYIVVTFFVLPSMLLGITAFTSVFNPYEV